MARLFTHAGPWLVEGDADAWMHRSPSGEGCLQQRGRWRARRDGAGKAGAGLSDSRASAWLGIGSSAGHPLDRRRGTDHACPALSSAKAGRTCLSCHWAVPQSLGRPVLGRALRIQPDARWAQPCVICASGRCLQVRACSRDKRHSTNSHPHGGREYRAGTQAARSVITSEGAASVSRLAAC